MARIVHHFLAILFGAACVGWIFYEPYSPKRLTRAIPAASTFVTRHDALGERWPEIVKNPVVVSTLLGLGLSEEDAAELPENSDLQKWINRLAGRRCYGAYIPSMGPDAESAWIATSWVGGFGYGLRMFASVIPIDELEKKYRHNGRQVWRIDLEGGSEDPGLQVAITEGVLIACYSRDSEAMKDLLDYYDGYLAGIGRMAEGPLTRLNEWALDHPDSGYAYLPYTSTLLFRLDAVTARRITGDFMTRGLKTTAVQLDAEAGNSEVTRLLGNIPLGMLALPTDLVAEVCMNRTASEFPQIIGTLLNNVESDMVTLSLLGGDYRGTLQKIRVPTFLIAARVPDHEQANQLADGLLHQTNGFKKLGLIAKQVEASHPLYALQSTFRRPYMQFPEEDLLAYALVDDLLLICSNVGVLQQLIQRYDTRVATFEAGQGEWLREFNDRPHQGLLWMNAARSGKAVKETLTAWSLTLLFEADTEQRALIKTIDESKTWVDRLMHLETIRAWHHVAGEQNTIRLELGPR